jgi:hypothetical protein
VNPPRIYKYTVPVDDEDHRIDLQGPILRVGSQNRGEVQFWAMHYGEDVDPVPYTFRVVGTGQPFPRGMVYVGSADDGPLVWHLLSNRKG